jgi:molybdate transport system permease protein
MAATPQRRDVPFLLCFAVLGGVYVVLIAGMLVADVAFLAQRAPGAVAALGSPEIRYSIRLSLLSCTVTTILALWTAVPLGYLLARTSFPGKALVDVLLDIPIVLPPLVVGLSLLILFRLPPMRQLDRVVPVMFAIPGVILAQYAVACAFAVRTMRVTFEQIPVRREQVALTLGCGRAGAFFRVVLPEARRGVLTAATLCWARALGEFGPILVFAGATRMQTEVLPTTVFLELSVGNLYAALAVSLLMVVAAVAVLLIVRAYGLRGGGPL